MRILRFASFFAIDMLLSYYHYYINQFLDRINQSSFANYSNVKQCLTEFIFFRERRYDAIVNWCCQKKVPSVGSRKRVFRMLCFLNFNTQKLYSQLHEFLHLQKSNCILKKKSMNWIIKIYAWQNPEELNCLNRMLKLFTKLVDLDYTFSSITWYRTTTDCQKGLRIFPHHKLVYSTDRRSDRIYGLGSSCCEWSTSMAEVREKRKRSCHEG